MTDDSIANKLIKSIEEIGAETVKDAAQQTATITESIITGKELLGNIKPMTEEEFNQKKAEDEKKKEEESKNLTGRNVEAEIEQIRSDKKEEEEKQEKFLEQIKQQQQEEEKEKQQLIASGNTQRELAKMRMMPQGKKKSMPDQSQMSQTAEFKGKID